MNLKKLLIISLLALATDTYSIYTPATGPIPLSDVLNKESGAITATLAQNKNTKLQAEATLINELMQLATPGQKTYQGMIEFIKIAESQQAIDALNAYAKVIMYLYQEKAYLVKLSFLPHCLSIARGIWDPCCDKAELDQLLNEYDQLATIAINKSPTLGLHMKAIVKSYKHWILHTLLVTPLYLSAACVLYKKIKTLKTFANGSKFLDMYQNIRENKTLQPAQQANSSMPKSVEDTLIQQLMDIKKSKDALWNKEILAVNAKNAAETAAELAVETKKVATSAKLAVETYGNKLFTEEQKVAQTFKNFATTNSNNAK